MNRRIRAWLGTVVFLVVAPGVVAGLIPWLITRWQMPDWGAWLWPVVLISAVFIVGGVVALLAAFVRFALADGTPAPPAPTAHLVIDGAYRHVRNPMYLAVAAIIIGQAILFASWGTALYLVIVLVAVATFVSLYEEPTLARAYGDEYREYKQNVPAWWPRWRPWRGRDAGRR